MICCSLVIFTLACSSRHAGWKTRTFMAHAQSLCSKGCKYHHHYALKQPWYLLQVVQTHAAQLDKLKQRQIPVVWFGIAQEVRLMGSFDNWTQGFSLSAEEFSDGTFTKFQSTLGLVPVSWPSLCPPPFPTPSFPQTPTPKIPAPPSQQGFLQFFCNAVA